jgi:hypothetical protein
MIFLGYMIVVHMIYTCDFFIVFLELLYFMSGRQNKDMAMTTTIFDFFGMDSDTSMTRWKFTFFWDSKYWNSSDFDNF